MSASEDPGVFIDSWQVPNTTSYISHSRRRELNCSTSDCSVCLDMLENHAFTPCHVFVRQSSCKCVSRFLSLHGNQYLCRTKHKFYFLFFRSHPARFVRFGCEMRSTSRTSVWLWLPTWLLATNSISALSGGVQITAVRCLAVNTTFRCSQRIRTQTGLSAQN